MSNKIKTLLRGSKNRAEFKEILGKEIENVPGSENLKEKYKKELFKEIVNDEDYQKLPRKQLIDDNSEVEKIVLKDKNYAFELIKKGNSSEIISNIDQFERLDKDVFLALIEAGFGVDLRNIYSNFIGLDKDVLLKLLNTQSSKGLDLMGYFEFNDLFFDSFEGFDEEILKKMVELDESSLFGISEHIHKFVGVDRKIFLLETFKLGYYDAIARYVENFIGTTGFTSRDIALMLLNAKNIKAVDALIGNIDKFKLENESEVLMLIYEYFGYDKLISAMTEPGAGGLLVLSDKLSNLDKNITSLLVNSKDDWSQLIISSLDKFQGLDDKDIYEELIKQRKKLIDLYKSDQSDSGKIIYDKAVQDIEKIKSYLYKKFSIFLLS